MALQLWMPLTKDFSNQGLYQSTPTTSGGSIVNGGKLGKCCLTNSTTYINTNVPFNVWNINLTSVSMCGWFKFNKSLILTVVDSVTLTGSLTYISCNLLGYNSYGGLSIECATNNLVSSSFSTLTVYGAYRNASTSYATKSYTITYDTWVHLALIYDLSESSLSLYVNGSLFLSKEIVNASYTETPTFRINNNNVFGGSGPAKCLPFYVNDVRLYDHALSQAEVHELALGLVVHYKMDDEYIEGTTNISSQGNCSGWNNSGTSTLNNNDTSISNIPELNGKTVSITQDTAGQSAITFGVTTMNVPSKTLTASVWFYMSGDITSVITPYIRSTKTDGTLGFLEYNGSSSISNWPKNTWIKITKTITTNAEATTIYFYAYTAKAGCKFVFNGWQIEEKDHATPFTSSSRTALTTIQDHSGYQNNGTIVGNLTASNDSPRYDKSLYFSSSSNYITHQNILDNTSQEWTVCCWVKPNQVSQAMQLNSFNLGNRIIYDITNMRALLYINSGTNDYYRYSSNNSIVYNEWFHIAFVFNYSEDIVSIYVNGLNVDGSKAGNNAKTPKGLIDTIYVLNSFIGYACDYREYSTALSSDDILSLYQLGARIDNKKNLHTFEIEENGLELPLKIQRNGASVCNEFIESDNASIRLDGTTESNNIYEI